MSMYPSAHDEIADLRRQLAETTRQRDALTIRLIDGLSEVADHFESEQAEATMIADFNDQQAAEHGIDTDGPADPAAQARADTYRIAALTVRRHILAAENDAPIPATPLDADLTTTHLAWQQRCDTLEAHAGTAAGPAAHRTLEALTHGIASRIHRTLDAQYSTWLHSDPDRAARGTGAADLPSWISPARIAADLTSSDTPPNTAQLPQRIYDCLHDQYRNMLASNVGRELAAAERYLHDAHSPDVHTTYLNHRDAVQHEFDRVRTATVELPEWIDTAAIAAQLAATTPGPDGPEPASRPGPSTGPTAHQAGELAADFPAPARLAVQSRTGAGDPNLSGLRQGSIASTLPTLTTAHRSASER